MLDKKRLKKGHSLLSFPDSKPFMIYLNLDVHYIVELYEYTYHLITNKVYKTNLFCFFNATVNGLSEVQLYEIF